MTTKFCTICGRTPCGCPGRQFTAAPWPHDKERTLVAVPGNEENPPMVDIKLSECGQYVVTRFPVAKIPGAIQEFRERNRVLESWARENWLGIGGLINLLEQAQAITPDQTKTAWKPGHGEFFIVRHPSGEVTRLQQRLYRDDEQVQARDNENRDHCVYSVDQETHELMIFDCRAPHHRLEPAGPDQTA